MTVARVLLAVALSACAADGAAVDTLPHDTYYSQDASRLSLCASGAYAYLQGDVIEAGIYHLEGSLAVATSSTGGEFTFDLSSRVMDTGSYTSPAWKVVPFVGDVGCTYNAP